MGMDAPITFMVSADRVKGGVIVASTWGELSLSVVDGRIVIASDALWKCDQFSLPPTLALAVSDAIALLAENACPKLDRSVCPSLLVAP